MNRTNATLAFEYIIERLDIMDAQLFAFDALMFVPFAAFGLFAAMAWLLMDWFSGHKPRAEQRLDEFRDPKKRKRQELEQRITKKQTMKRMLERATPRLAKPLQPKNANDAGKLKLRLAHAGFRGESAPTVFLGLKLILLIIAFVGAGGTVLTLAQINQTSIFTQSTLFKVIIAAGVSFYIPDLLVAMMARKRKQAIFLGLPDALDLLVVCVEAGLGLDQAMRKVADEMKKSYRIIAEEFGLCNLQMQMGRTRGQVLQELGERSGVEDLRSLASILIQADKFGSSIAQALRVQSDSMRTRRRQIAEEKAAKTAVKLIFPLVMFIFPGIFVVLVGPAAITMIREMFPAMSGG